MSLLALLLLTGERPPDRYTVADLVGGSARARQHKEGSTRRLAASARTRADGPELQCWALSGHRQTWLDTVESCRHAPACAPQEWTPADAERVSRGSTSTWVVLDGEWALAVRGRVADLHLTALVRLADWHRLRAATERVIDPATRGSCWSVARGPTSATHAGLCRGGRPSMSTLAARGRAQPADIRMRQMAGGWTRPPCVGRHPRLCCQRKPPTGPWRHP